MNSPFLVNALERSRSVLDRFLYVRWVIVDCLMVDREKI